MAQVVEHRPSRQPWERITKLKAKPFALLSLDQGLVTRDLLGFSQGPRDQVLISLLKNDKIYFKENMNNVFVTHC
jgi:hypothetical protein